ncbi:uncharacterized protein LOC141855870 [Brevipalpus obovatus]|uniref:uncharacterized protein LOC141855870 n=1 Tax=Brevipalpus obovatus TaxID=246614 RepID=UPI003D9DB77E
MRMENPFRPGGELSREAEEIVNLIKEGKPITPSTSPNNTMLDICQPDSISPTTPSPSNSFGKKNGHHYTGTSSSSPKNSLSPSIKQHTNGTPKSSPAVFELEHSVVTTSEPPKADIVTIKRKSKCNCCVVQ